MVSFNLRSFCLVQEMIFRGTDTVAILMEWIMARMALHPDIQAKAATDRNLTETPSHLLSLASWIHRFFPFSFIHSRFSPHQLLLPELQSLRSSIPKPAGLWLQASPSSYEAITNQVSSRGERGNLLGRFAACFATTSWCHGGGAASRARLICSWKGVHRFLLVS